MDKDSTPADNQVPETPSPAAQIGALFGEVRSLAEAEIDYAKARLSYSGGIVRKAGLFALLSIIALSGAAIALILGLLLIITSYWGPIVATVTVVLAFAAATYVFAVIARSTARNLKFDEDRQDD